jgi:HK97 gp10 family phage protein
MSVEVEIHVEGLDDLQRKLESLGSALQNRVHEGLVEGGVILENAAKSFAPYRTGFLESTIFARVVGWVLRFGATAPYARFVEFGTRFIKTRRFLSQALQYCMPDLSRRLNEAVDKAIQEVKG